MISLDVAAEMSVKLLEDLPYPDDDKNLLYFLGCLPGGLSMGQLKELWRDPEEPVEMLRKMSFLEKGVDKFVLTANLI